MPDARKIAWPVPEEFPELRTREIHLWSAWLDQPGALDPASAGLSPDEITRAASFRFERDRGRFVAARRNLRQVLARYVGRDAGTLVFSYGRFGKPMLIHQAASTGPLDPAMSNLAFNQSHGGPLWLLAVAWNQPVGVDVEELRDLDDLALVEAQIFPGEELTHQQSLPQAERQLGFFHRWTQRESAVKFQGLGFDPAAKFVPPDQSEFHTPAEGYVAALAYGGTAVRVRKFGWSESVKMPAPTVAVI